MQSLALLGDLGAVEPSEFIVMLCRISSVHHATCSNCRHRMSYSLNSLKGSI